MVDKTHGRRLRGTVTPKICGEVDDPCLCYKEKYKKSPYPTYYLFHRYMKWLKKVIKNFGWKFKSKKVIRKFWLDKWKIYGYRFLVSSNPWRDVVESHEDWWTCMAIARPCANVVCSCETHYAGGRTKDFIHEYASDRCLTFNLQMHCPPVHLQPPFPQ